MPKRWSVRNSETLSCENRLILLDSGSITLPLSFAQCTESLDKPEYHRQCRVGVD